MEGWGMPAVDAAAPPTNINYGQSQEEFIRLFFEKEVLSQRIVQVCCNTFNQPNFLGAQNET